MTFQDWLDLIDTAIVAGVHAYLIWDAKRRDVRPRKKDGDQGKDGQDDKS